MSKKLNIIFDFDGVIINSHLTKTLAFYNIFKVYGKNIALKAKKFHLNNSLNDLPGNEWSFFLRSVINTRYPTAGKEGYAHQIRKIHPSPKPPQLMQEIINFFTKENELVFDYFM